MRCDQAVRGFPGALADSGLEYSGIFEDGWISDAAYVILQAPSPAGKANLHVSGLIPDVGGVPFDSVISVKVEDQTVYSSKLSKGLVDIRIPLDASLFKGNAAKVQVESSALQRLPNGDDRLVSMHLTEIVLE